MMKCRDAPGMTQSGLATKPISCVRAGFVPSIGGGGARHGDGLARDPQRIHALRIMAGSARVAHSPEINSSPDHKAPSPVALSAPPPPRPARASRFWELVALGLILCIAAGLRFPHLRDVPPGLWFDEALNGQDAVAVWQPGGHFKLVYPDEFPREPLFETILALAVRAFGPQVVVMRSVSALIGLLTVLLLYLMVRRNVGAPEALCAAGVLATLRWHVIFSRLVFRTLILGPWMLGLVWAALAFRRRMTLPRAVLLGIFLGGGFYTYLAWYFLLPLVMAIVLWLAWAACRTSGGWRPLTLALACALLVYLPLGIHYLRVPSDLLARPGAVSVFSSGPRAAAREILKNTREALLMFHWRGDHVPKQNIPHAPALDRIQGAFFLVGLLLCGVAAWRKRPLSLILLGWILCGLTATIFTHTDSPNFLRTLCITPAVAAVTGIGLAGIARLSARRLGAKGAVALATLLLCATALWTGRDVYAVWPKRQDVWQSFNGDISQLARFAAQSPPDVAVYVPQFLFEHRSFQFQSLGHRNIFPYADWSFLDPWPPSAPAQSLRAQSRPRPAARWIIVTANNGLLQPLRDIVPAPRGSVLQGFTAPAGNTWAAVYVVPETGLPPANILRQLQNRWRREMRF